MSGEVYGGGSFGELKAMGNQRANVELSRKHQLCHFFLKGEIRGIASNQILLVNANRRQINLRQRSPLRVGEQQNLPGSTHDFHRLFQCRIGWNRQDSGVDVTSV
jgi:hypothetical protein